MTLSPWNDTRYTYSVGQINLGNNPISLLEIVSALDSFNLARGTYAFNFSNRINKYYPKVHLGAVQTASENWNLDTQTGQKTDFSDPQKSGSCV